MAKIVNIVGSGSNVGKTNLMEGLIKELVKRDLRVGTIKHDVHGFDIDHKGKDTYRHREAGSKTVIISSKNRLAVIKELEKECELYDLLSMMKDKDIILVEGYKKSNLRKIEVYRSDRSKALITPKDKLIAVASDILLDNKEIICIIKDDFKSLADLVEKEEEYNFEK